MAVESLTREPRFRALAVRVRMRGILASISFGLSVGVIGAALITLGGKASGLAWLEPAAGWLVLATCGAVAYALIRAPDTWAVARAADGLGLAERVTSAVYAEAREARVSSLLVADARRALSQMDPMRYAVHGSPRVWQAPALGAVVWLVLVLAPIPRVGVDARGAADASRVTAAQQHVAAIELRPAQDAQRQSPLAERTREELHALRDALARSQSSADAARTIENTQRQLAQLPGADDYAWRRALDAMATSLERDQALIPLAHALRERDAPAVDRALADLAARFDQPGAMTDAERAQLRNGLQAAANAAAASQPRLASALRRAASATSGSGLSSSELQDVLSEGTIDAAALDALERSQVDLSNLRAMTLPTGATLVPATGTPTAYALLRGTPPPNATLVGVPARQSGAGASSGSGAGTGPQGSGAGGGAGYGDTPTQGQPSDRDASATNASSGQPKVAPNAASATAYDPVYAPSRLGGDGGPEVQVQGDATGARGAGVDLPQGPLTVGDVRPYDQVYAQYAREARQATSRQSLPSNVQNLVDRYFGSIAPNDTPVPSPSGRGSG